MALAALSCDGGLNGAGNATVLAEAQTHGQHGVGLTTLELVDTSRPTAPNHEFPGSEQRVLTTDIYYPSSAPGAEPVHDAPIAEEGGFPVIVLSHGLSSSRILYVSSAKHLASHGYVVGLPDFPLSSLSAPGGPRLNAVVEQPKDLSFVLDQVLALSEQPDSLLAGAIDPDRIGATGHSLGAMTTFMSVYGPDRDARIGAALPFATPGCFFPEDYVPDDISVPILFVVGTHDLITPSVSSGHAFGIANSPKYLLTIAGADHTRFADIDLPDTAIVGDGVLEDIGQGDFLSDATELGRFFQGDLDACGLGAQPGAGAGSLLDAERQREILRAVQVTFFDAYLRDEDDSRKALDQLHKIVQGVAVDSETEE